MVPEIQENVSDFIIQGLSDTPGLQLPLFVLFLIIYLFIIIGNLLIFFIILLNSDLHTPMYKFLQNLSIIDISFTTVVLPDLLHLLITKKNKISFFGCMTQMYLYLSLNGNEYFLLMIMSYDRYVAICDPLHYINRMSEKCFAWLISAANCAGFLGSVCHVVLISKLSYCHSHLINHFFCDLIPLLKLSCSDTFIIEILTYVVGTLLAGNSFLLTLISYIYIISTILKIQSTHGRQKAFSTCASHLTCVIILYMTLICLYMKPTTSYSPNRDKFFSLLCIVLVPLLNPLIYTIKNKEFLIAFNKLRQKVKSFVFPDETQID
ncbi:hypothetical protein GDO86_013561 [Hymenochirus boettgeri]|uniref:G-protein coupled receptors family 1 profile domain-containing protein n=1 Tax=Hymenochirus boettgeri TaxID=247094 RepID=A0A8T2IVW5_9PIPI|nr:hypothetical protein GDO86_013561 [Hymenochirus boettgeri]